MAAVGFLSNYLSGPLPYVRRHITINKMCSSASINKIFPFLSLFVSVALICLVLYLNIFFFCDNLYVVLSHLIKQHSSLTLFQ